jgi:hypothetical protein
MVSVDNSSRLSGEAFAKPDGSKVHRILYIGGIRPPLVAYKGGRDVYSIPVIKEGKQLALQCTKEVYNLLVPPHRKVLDEEEDAQDTVQRSFGFRPFRVVFAYIPLQVENKRDRGVVTFLSDAENFRATEGEWNNNTDPRAYQALFQVSKEDGSVIIVGLHQNLDPEQHIPIANELAALTSIAPGYKVKHSAVKGSGIYVASTEDKGDYVQVELRIQKADEVFEQFRQNDDGKGLATQGVSYAQGIGL